MKAKTFIIIALIIVFAIAVGFALMREVNRDKAELAKSISGTVELSPQLVASGNSDVVRTDRLVLLLVDPTTHKPVALKFITPLVPPQTIRIGQDNAENGQKLKGPYILVGITDKDGEIFKATPGEVYGRSAQPVPLGTKEFHLTLTAPFHGTLFNEMPSATAEAPAGPMPPAMAAGGPMSGGGPLAGASDHNPKYSIAGTITVSKALAKDIDPSDHIVVLLFDPDQARPVAFQIIPHALMPQRFIITLPQDARAHAKKGYMLHVVTDKDNNPFHAAPGELVGRSRKPIPLGTKDLTFELDQPYTQQ